MADPRTVSYVPLDQIRPHPGNPKNHDLPGIRASIAGSTTENGDQVPGHGFTEPLLVCERTELLAAGHGRWQVLVEMYAAHEPVPAGIVVDDDGQWCVPVIRGWSSRTDAELAAYVIKDNLLTLRGGWDDRALAALLEQINADDPAMFDSLGYSADEMDALIAVASGAQLGEADDQSQPAGDAGDGEEDGDGDVDGLAGVDAATGERVTCPHCGGTFTPGDKAVF